jgi:predicted lipoprotein with Yx(FWY)xxD motif
VTAEYLPVKRQLLISGGAVGLLILAACGSATASSGGVTTPTATAVPSQTPVPTSPPTPTATPAPTAAPATPPPATGTVVSLRSVGGFGQILVGVNGRTLYFFLADKGMTSTCTGSCAQNWPPVTTKGAPRTMAGVSQGLLGTTRRGDGTIQVTYHGHPLYYFIADSAAGMASGEGLDAFGARWEVVNAAGVAVVK